MCVCVCVCVCVFGGGGGGGGGLGGRGRYMKLGCLNLQSLKLPPRYTSPNNNSDITDFVLTF